MLKKIIYIILLIYIIIPAQSVYEPTYKTDIYNFVERLSNKNKINIFTDIRPLTRMQIAELLFSIKQSNNHPISLSPIEKERLGFYLREYFEEIKYLANDTTSYSNFFGSAPINRFNLYKFYNERFALIVDPVIGIGYNISDKIYHQYVGFELYGRIGERWGYYFNWRDNTEKGDNLDREKLFSSETGVQVLTNESDLIDYSETRGGITYSWNIGSITAAKDFLHIGSSSQSSIILSNKAPSFPYLRFELQPTKWFRYNFIHAWLDSDLIDSSTVRYTGVESTRLNRSYSHSSLQKYYVSHSLSFQPFEDWWLTFGESIIYGDELEFVYFLPVFYRLADHYISIGGADTGDNAQLFFNTSYIWAQIKSKLYFTLYIDELSIDDLIKGGDNAQVFALTLGGQFTNPLWSDNFITLEYNAIRPYVGMNADPLHTYESSEYQLGHWIGSNSVQIYAEMEQYLPLMINLKAYLNYVIKGEKENINDYYNRIASTYSLLSGDNSYFSEFGFDISFNPQNNLIIELKFKYINNSSGRFINEFNKEKGFSFATMLRYGFN